MTAGSGTGVLQINGSPTDAAAGLIKKGIHEGLDNSGYPILAEYDTPEWAPPKAQQWASGQITRFGKNILGVVAANDGTGGGAIAAFKAAGVDPVPPVTGNDATIAALQLIIAGDQYNTISKPSEIVAAAAANVAVQLLSRRNAEGRDDALQHAVQAVRSGRGHGREPEGRDHRQEDQYGRTALRPAAMPKAARSWASPSNPRKLRPAAAPGGRTSCVALQSRL